MSESGQDDDVAKTTATVVEAVRRAEIALENVRQAIRQGKWDDLGAKAAAATATLLKEGEALVAESETLTQANTKLTGAIKRNPLGALAVAFGAGLLIALITRG